VVASLAVDEAGRLRGEPKVSAPGLFDPDSPEAAEVAGEFAEGIAELPLPQRRDGAALSEAARAVLRRVLGRRVQKRPLVDVHLLRI